MPIAPGGNRIPTPITNGERAKIVISAMVSFAVGSQTKIDNNIFQEKTIDVLSRRCAPAGCVWMRLSRTLTKAQSIRTDPQTIPDLGSPH